MSNLSWQAGETCEVVLEGTKYQAKVLETAFSSEGDYLQTKLEYTVDYQDWNGVWQTQTRIWPKPVQSYRLTTTVETRKARALKPRRNHKAENEAAKAQIQQVLASMDFRAMEK